MDLESEQALFEFGQRGEIVGRQDFSLNDREIDLDLVEPTGVDGSVDEDRVGPFGAEAFDRFLAPMSGTVVHDPEDAASGFVGLLGHDFSDEAFHRSNPVLDFAAAEDLGTMDVPSSQISPGAFTKVLVLDSGRAVRSGRQSRLLPASGLNAGLFVRRDDKVMSAQWSALPNAVVEIEDGAGFGRKVGIAREDPASMLPGAEGIAAEPAPQGGAADLGDETLRNHVLPDLVDRETGQRKPEAVREFTGKASARRMIFARITSQYGDVYLRAMDSSDRRSSLERFISNGLFLGIEGQAASDASLTDYVTESTLKYVTVFSNRST